MMRILVTGGTGFIGCHLTEFLLKKGHNVYVIDNNYSGSLENFEDFSDDLKKKLFFKEFDVVDLTEWDNINSDFFGSNYLEFEKKKTEIKNLKKKTIIGQNNFHQIFHLACPASPVYYQKDPVKTLITSVYGMRNTLEIAQRHKSRILFTSTSEVYGDPHVHPQVETYWGNVNCTGIRSCYDEGKRAAESLCYDFQRTRGVDIRIVRIFNTYGPKMKLRDGRIVSNFILQALLGKPITVYGTGEQTRSFCFISDMINGFDKLMNEEKNLEGLNPCNIGNPGEFTVNELAKIINDVVCDGKNEIKKFPLPKDDPKQRRPNISKAKKYLNWEPLVPLKDGLTATIKDFKKRLKKNGELK